MSDLEQIETSLNRLLLGVEPEELTGEDELDEFEDFEELEED